MSKAQSPWPDYSGNALYEGDTIEHPSGETGVIELHSGFDSVHDKWRVKYHDGTLSRLYLQVGEKGRAVKAN